jgi:hypothetical protein
MPVLPMLERLCHSYRRISRYVPIKQGFGLFPCSPFPKETTAPPCSPTILLSCQAQSPYPKNILLLYLYPVPSPSTQYIVPLSPAPVPSTDSSACLPPGVVLAVPVLVRPLQVAADSKYRYSTQRVERDREIKVELVNILE